MKTTVLLLMSDAINLRVIGEALESDGYFVERASDIGSAIKRLEECTPDLLIVRHYTDSLSGHDAAMRLRQICPGLPVLMVGGLLDDDRLKNREIIEGFDLFPRPFRAAELLGKVKEMLLKASSRHKAKGLVQPALGGSQN
jgi:DNA-binding response OmpR family regulator